MYPSLIFSRIQTCTFRSVRSEAMIKIKKFQTIIFVFAIIFLRTLNEARYANIQIRPIQVRIKDSLLIRLQNIADYNHSREIISLRLGILMSNLSPPDHQFRSLLQDILKPMLLWIRRRKNIPDLWARLTCKRGSMNMNWIHF